MKIHAEDIVLVLLVALAITGMKLIPNYARPQLEGHAAFTYRTPRPPSGGSNLNDTDIEKVLVTLDAPGYPKLVTVKQYSRANQTE